MRFGCQTGAAGGEFTGDHCEPVAAAARREAAEERWDRLEPHPTDMPILNDAGAAAYPRPADGATAGN